jgi:hypothetical protein
VDTDEELKIGLQVFDEVFLVPTIGTKVNAFVRCHDGAKAIATSR